MASPDGVFRFDGISFERMDSEIDPTIYGKPLRVLVTRSGEIWTWYDGRRTFAVYRGGRFHLLPSPKIDGTITHIVEAPDGSIWASAGEIGRPILRYYRGRWQQFDPSVGFGQDFLMRIAFTADHAVWLSYMGMVLRRGEGQTRFERAFSDPDGWLRLILDRQGRVWVTGVRQTVLLSGPGGRWPAPPGKAIPFSYGGPAPVAPLLDRDGNLWVAVQDAGLVRLRSGSSGWEAAAVDRYGPSDGLGSSSPTSIFEDREGNIWVGSTRGLERFRSTDIVVEPLLTKKAVYGDILFAASNGDVYVAEADTVYRIRPGQPPMPFITGTRQPEAICEARDHTLWFAFADRLLAISGSVRRGVERPKADSGIYDCGQDSAGRFWMSAASNGLYRRDGDKWVLFPGENTGDRSRYYPADMTTDGAGNLWLNWGRQVLARMDASGPAKFQLGKYDDVMPLRELGGSADGVLIAGTRGIGRFRDGTMELATGARMGALLRANGLVQTPAGETWAQSRAGFVRIMTRDLERAFREPGYTPPLKVLGFADGLPEVVVNQASHTLVRGGDGRIWGATGAGTVWFDPAKLRHNPLPPPVAITALTADGNRQRDPGAATLRAGTSDVAIQFAAPSLSIPERVAVRYQLLGYDDDWIDAGGRREAFYTHLPPGTYRFRVIAANNDGVWNQEGATLEFTIPPTFLQSLWFKLLIALAVIGLGVLAYRFRMRQVTARMQAQFDIRIAERERIARELHDTLLQGFQGLMLRFQAVADRVPKQGGVRDDLHGALESAETVLVDGRARVRDLRGPSVKRELPDSLRDVAAATPVAVSVEGSPRPLQELVREEALAIGTEAIRNAAQHARATRIHVILRYGPREFSLEVRDDGVGLPDAIRARGAREGHFGLVGMRERAARIGGTLRLTGESGKGTAVRLTVPERAAYPDARRRWFGIRL